MYNNILGIEMGEIIVLKEKTKDAKDAESTTKVHRQ